MADPVGSGQGLEGVGDAGSGEAFGVRGLGAHRDQGFLQAGDLAAPDPFTGLGRLTPAALQLAARAWAAVR